nr:hypothetical protein [Tanacetum cinerariifolium]
GLFQPAAAGALRAAVCARCPRWGRLRQKRRQLRCGHAAHQVGAGCGLPPAILDRCLGAPVSTAEAETLASNFWDDSKAAEAKLKEIKSIKTWTDDYEAVQRAVADTDVLFDFYREGEATEAEIQAEYDATQQKVEALEFKRMLSDEEDQLPAVI